MGDGDTLRVVDGSKRLTIRMACIDAPETAQRPYGAASRQRLQELAPVGSVVSLRSQTIDKYGRTVAEVFRGGQNVNLAMVSSGQAFAYRKYLGACDPTSKCPCEPDGPSCQQCVVLARAGMAQGGCAGAGGARRRSRHRPPGLAGDPARGLPRCS